MCRYDFRVHHFIDGFRKGREEICPSVVSPGLLRRFAKANGRWILRKAYLENEFDEITQKIVEKELWKEQGMDAN
jgi:hypothetical protein